MNGSEPLPGDSRDDIVASLRQALGSETATPFRKADALPVDEQDVDGEPRPQRHSVSAAALSMADDLIAHDARTEFGVTSCTVRIGAEQRDVESQSLTLGRQPDDGSPPIGDGRVSRRHARIFVRQDRWYVEDLGSSNGTFVVREVQRLDVGSDAVLLEAGDLITTIDDTLLAEVIDINDVDE